MNFEVRRVLRSVILISAFSFSLYEFLLTLFHYLLGDYAFSGYFYEYVTSVQNFNNSHVFDLDIVSIIYSIIMTYYILMDRGVEYTLMLTFGFKRSTLIKWKVTSSLIYPSLSHLLYFLIILISLNSLTNSFNFSIIYSSLLTVSLLSQTLNAVLLSSLLGFFMRLRGAGMALSIILSFTINIYSYALLQILGYASIFGIIFSIITPINVISYKLSIDLFKMQSNLIYQSDNLNKIISGR